MRGERRVVWVIVEALTLGTVETSAVGRFVVAAVEYVVVVVENFVVAVGKVVDVVVVVAMLESVGDEGVVVLHHFVLNVAFDLLHCG